MTGISSDKIVLRDTWTSSATECCRVAAQNRRSSHSCPFQDRMIIRIGPLALAIQAGRGNTLISNDFEKLLRAPRTEIEHKTSPRSVWLTGLTLCQKKKSIRKSVWHGLSLEGELKACRERGGGRAGCVASVMDSAIMKYGGLSLINVKRETFVIALLRRSDAQPDLLLADASLRRRQRKPS